MKVKYKLPSKRVPTNIDSLVAGFFFQKITYASSHRNKSIEYRVEYHAESRIPHLSVNENLEGM